MAKRIASAARAKRLYPTGWRVDLRLRVGKSSAAARKSNAVSRASFVSTSEARRHPAALEVEVFIATPFQDKRINVPPNYLQEISRMAAKDQRRRWKYFRNRIFAAIYMGQNPNMAGIVPSSPAATCRGRLERRCVPAAPATLARHGESPAEQVEFLEKQTNQGHGDRSPQRGQAAKGLHDLQREFVLCACRKNLCNIGICRPLMASGRDVGVILSARLWRVHSSADQERALAARVEL